LEETMAKAKAKVKAPRGTKESGWAKAKRMGREKRARVEAAREADPKAAE